MFSKAKKPTSLDEALNRAYQKLKDAEVGSEEYVKILDGIVKLHKMQEDEKPDQVSMDTAALIGANILGILLIIRHEHVNVITSRAVNMITKPR